MSDLGAQRGWKVGDRGRDGCWLGGAAADLLRWRQIRGAGSRLGRGLCSPERRWCGWSPLAADRQIGAAMAVEKLGLWPQLGSSDLLIVFLFCVYLYLYFVCLYLIPGLRVIFTLCALVLCRIRFIIPRMVFVSPT